MMNKRDEILKNCKQNTEKSLTETFENALNRVNTIANEISDKKNHTYHDMYSHIYNEYPTIYLDFDNKGNIISCSDSINISLDSDCNKTSSEINWCDTCEGTTLKDCLVCVKGDKNPNWNKSESTIKNETDEIDNTEKHFLKSVKNAKTENLEKIYDVIVKELASRYLLNYKEEDIDCKCNNCKECECQEDKDLTIQGKLYYRKNDGEPLEIKVELSDNDIKDMKKEVETEINKVVNDLIKNLRMFKYFKF